MERISIVITGKDAQKIATTLIQTVEYLNARTYKDTLDITLLGTGDEWQIEQETPASV